MRYVDSGLAVALALVLGCRGEPEEHEAHHHEHAATETHAEHAGHEQHQELPATRPSSDTSLFQLTSPFTDQNDHPFTFESLRGHPTLVVMFYGSCETICPVILEDLRSIDESLAPELRSRVRILLVTFDPERDTTERLRALVPERHFDPARTIALRGPESSIRELSMVLGVQYRKLPDGNFSHTALITLLDPSGSIAERIEGLHGNRDALLARLRAMP